MFAVTSEAVCGHGQQVRVMVSDTWVLWVSSDEVPEAVLSGTSRRQAVDSPAKRLSAWGQTAWNRNSR